MKDWNWVWQTNAPKRSVEQIKVAHVEFARRINERFIQGSELNGHKNKSLSNMILASVLAISPSTLTRWRNGRTLPHPQNFIKLLEAWFGDNLVSSIEANELINLYNIASSFDLRIVPDLVEADEKSLQQLPASYRFGIKDNKIDALAESAESIDRDTSNEIYEELKVKLDSLIKSLKGSNADPNSLFAAERLRDGLRGAFNEMRPGVILSRMRGIEAVRDAYDSDEGRDLLFPGAIAAFNDVCLSGQDFLATFPIVREIERQRIALEVEKTPEMLRRIQIETAAIQEAAANSEVVAPGAVVALLESEVDIEKSRTNEQAADLVADKLLIVRNFASEAVRSVLHNGAEAWEVVKPDFQHGVRTAARILPPLAVIALITSIAGPIAGLAGLLRSDIFKPVRDAIPKVQNARSQTKRRRKFEQNDSPQT